MDCIINIKNLSMKYSKNGYYSLKNISLDIKEGEIIGLIGPNGAGKTTLIKCICGLLKPTSVDKFLISNVEIMKTKNINIGLILNSNQLYDDLSGKENVKFYLSLHKITIPQEKITEIFKLVGLEGEQNKLVLHYSTGMKQKLNIAKILCSKANIIIMDEPTSGMDPISKIDIYNLIKVINLKYKKTIIISNHVISEVEQYCKHVIALNEGKIIINNNISHEMALYSKTVSELICSKNFKNNILEKYPKTKYYTRYLNDNLLKMVLFNDILYDNIVNIIGNKCQSFMVRKTELEDVFFYRVLNNNVVNNRGYNVFNYS